jgi:hypothetical protein
MNSLQNYGLAKLYLPAGQDVQELEPYCEKIVADPSALFGELVVQGVTVLDPSQLEPIRKKSRFRIGHRLVHTCRTNQARRCRVVKTRATTEPQNCLD